MSEERWLPVVGYEGRYEVSDMGRVRSLDRLVATQQPKERKTFKGRMLRPVKFGDRKNYLAVCLHRDAKPRQTTRRVHVLVLEAFVGPRPDGQYARHLNGEPSDNRLANLAWGTLVENAADQFVHGTRAHKFNEATMEAAKRDALMRVEPLAITARRYGMTPQHLGEVIRGESRIGVITEKRGE